MAATETRDRSRAEQRAAERAIRIALDEDYGSYIDLALAVNTAAAKAVRAEREKDAA